MRQLLTTVVIILSVAAAALAQSQARTLVDNDRVRVLEIPNGTGRVPGMARAVAVKVPSGEASWIESGDRPDEPFLMQGTVVFVAPKDAPPTPAPPAGTQPGDATFTGMSFKTLFENAKVRVIRARMEVGAREAFHTHGSDTVVVHLTGGDIEDTAAGKTKVNHWKPGDVEFEAKGSSHSARNVGQAVDVVLVALK
jgi:quercetin dioxygenase-like cupin family protein